MAHPEKGRGSLTPGVQAPEGRLGTDDVRGASETRVCLAVFRQPISPSAPCGWAYLTEPPSPRSKELRMRASQQRMVAGQHRRQASARLT